jgi:cytochrome P450
LLNYFTENERKIRRLDNELDTVLKTVIRKEHEKIMNGDKQHRSVATLSLSGVETLTPEILQQTSDTCRGFLFAGHDTTSILMQWVFYELARHPTSMEALTKELDSVFGPDPNPASVMEQLSGPSNGELMGRLTCKYLHFADCVQQKNGH